MMHYTVLCLNPARDIVLKLDGSLKPGDKNIARKTKECVSGKGVNVATFLSERISEKISETEILPEVDEDRDSVTLITFSNENEKEEIRKRIGENACLAAVPKKENMRCCYKIISDNGMTEINEKGNVVDESELKGFVTMLAEDVSTEKMQTVLMCGSIPQGVEKDVYFFFIKLLNECGKRSVLDTSGTALAMGVKARPTLIKPNISELYSLYLDENALEKDGRIMTEKEFSTGTAAVDFANRIMLKYGCRVLCTLGEKGSFYVNRNYVFFADCPQVNVENLAGAGDCYLTNFVFDGGMEDDDPDKVAGAMRSAGAHAAVDISKQIDRYEEFKKNINITFIKNKQEESR